MKMKYYRCWAFFGGGGGGGSFVLEMYFIPAQFRSKVSNKTTV